MTIRTVHLRAAPWILCVLATGCAQADPSQGNPPADGPDSGDASASADGAADSVAPHDAVWSEADAVGCGGEVSAAQLVPLDLYIMLDASGSMSREVSGTLTKWEAVRQALDTFTSDTSTQSLNLGLQLFPLMKAGVPATCTSTTECNGFGPCVQPKICDNHYFAGNVVACSTPDDCVSGQDTGNCLPQGACAGDANLVCLPEFEAVCKNNLGECSAVPAFCAGRQSCDVSDYATPAVPMGPRADVAGGIMSAIAGRTPDGATPTGPALQGGISYLEQWLSTHTNERGAVVLVTDGLPTDCSPVDIDEVASIAQAAAPHVITYVIGVFEDEQAQVAQQNLDSIAAAGQTGDAFIVTTSQDVTAQFVAQLASIRAHSIACEYAIPEPTEGDFHPNLVNVEYAPGDGSSETISYVGSEDGCGADTGGWYYDVAPEDGGTPTQIRLCGMSCHAIQGNPDGAVSIRLGCPTIVK